jgi:hypothetical protein
MVRLGFEAGKGSVGQARPEEGGGEDGTVEEAVLPKLRDMEVKLLIRWGVGGRTNESVVDDGPHFDVISASNYQAFETPQHRPQTFISAFGLPERVKSLVVV